MPPKRTLLLDKGKVTASNLLEVQQHHPQHQLHIEIEPLARGGMHAVSKDNLTALIKILIYSIMLLVNQDMAA